MEIEFLSVTIRRFGQALEQFERAGEVVDRLHIGRTLDGSFAGALPMRDRRYRLTGLRIVMREQFRFAVRDLGMFPHQRLGDRAMQPLPLAMQQPLVCCISDQGVLEDIALRDRRTATEHQLGRHEIVERRPQLNFVEHNDGREQISREIAADHRRHLSDLLGWAKTVETSD